MSQVCTICKVEKPLSEFYIRKASGKYRKDCKVCHKLQGYAYVSKNKEKINEYKRQWADENKDRLKPLVKKSKAKYRAKAEVRSKEKAYMDAWHAAHKEHAREYNKRNAMSSRIRAHKRRSYIRKDGGELSLDVSAKLMVLQKGKCRICKKKLNGKFELDHIVPVSKGGRHIDSNIQLLCVNCNRTKGAKLPHVHAHNLGMLFL